MGVIEPGNIEVVEVADEGVIKEGLDFLRETFGS